MRLLLFPALLVVVNGHGVLYEPPSRNAAGNWMLGPGCPGGSCLWFNQGCSIGCPNATGNGTVFPAVPDCKNPDNPTIGRFNASLRTVFSIPEVDWTKWHPWRKPGSAPIENPCGLAGGWYTEGVPGNGGDAPPGTPQGFKGTDIKPLFKETVWVAGKTTEVAWGVYANHGGGYSYRLCPAGREPTEKCFQEHPLTLLGDKQWLQWGYGRDVNNRSEIPAVRITEGTVPTGSQWTRNPIPACAGVEDAISLGAFNTPCTKPQFPPPVKGVFGFGGGSCGSSLPGTQCTPSQFEKQSFDFGIVDKVQIPDLPEGRYILSFRWESEQTPQVWNSCGDITIKHSGKNSETFQVYEGCEACCGDILHGGICSNCTKCLDDKTGKCKYCWDPLKGYNPSMTPVVYCLGFDDPETGGPTKFQPGDPLTGGSSFGCTRCWEQGACDRSYDF